MLWLARTGVRLGAARKKRRVSGAGSPVSADRPMQCRNCIGVSDRVARSASVLAFFAAFLVGL